MFHSYKKPAPVKFKIEKSKKNFENLIKKQSKT